MRRTLPKYYDEKRDLVQCQVCFKWFKNVGAHIRIHKLNKKKYQKKFGLINGDLIALSVRYNMSNSGKVAIEKNPKRKKMMLKASKKGLKKAWIMPKIKNERTKECRGKRITEEKRLKMNEGIRKFAKSKKGKENYKKQGEQRKKGFYRKCANCGKKYWVIPFLKNTSKYCSNECKNKMMGIEISNKLKGKKKPKGFGETISKRLKGKIRPNMRIGKYINCIICGKEIYVKPFLIGKKFLCSNKCRGEYKTLSSE